MKRSGESGERSLVMREYSATVGATDGNIIAAIITTHDPEEPAERSEAGPGPVVHPPHLADGPPPADAGEREELRRRAPRRNRTAANGGARPPPLEARGATRRAGSSRPRELGLSTARSCPRRRCRRRRSASAWPRPSSGRTHRMEHAVEANGLAGLDPKGDDVLDLEVDDVTDADAVTESVVGTSIGARSTPRISLTNGVSAPIGPPSWPPKTWTSLSACSSVASSSMNTPSRQLPSVMTFGVSAITATVRPPMAVPSTSPACGPRSQSTWRASRPFLAAQKCSATTATPEGPRRPHAPRARPWPPPGRSSSPCRRRWADAPPPRSACRAAGRRCRTRRGR